METAAGTETTLHSTSRLTTVYQTEKNLNACRGTSMGKKLHDRISSGA